jgi:hypothetical protein
MATDFGLDGQGLIHSRGKRFFTLHNFQTGSGADPLGSGASFPKGKLAIADCSPPSSAEVKNSGAIPPLFPYIFIAWCLTV